MTPPTPEQRHAFVEHVCGAHSWYKHLDLVEGGELSIFLAEDAGAGYETHERLHHTWQTTAEYRARFGHLDYVWRRCGGEWNRDGDCPVPIVDERSSVRVYPWCSNDGNAVEVIVSRMRSHALQGLPSAVHAQLVELADAHTAAEAAFQQLTDAQRERAFDEDLRDPPVAAHAALETRVFDLYEALRAPEIELIRDAVELACGVRW